MIKPLPKWVLTNEYPAFYDTESVTAIEMVAKLYGSMEELITDYNDFIDGINEAIQDFESGIITDFNDFKELIQAMVDDYIETIDTKIELQDTTIENAITNQNTRIENAITNQDEAIADAIQYMKDNIIQTTTNLYLNDGSIYVSLKETYDSTEEQLTLAVEATPSEDLLEELSELATPTESEGEQ